MFLPVCKKDMIERGWDEVDFVFVNGDSYVDHPSFGVAIITRILEANGYKVAILSQPRWDNESDFLEFGKPRLGFLVSSGNLDSMVNHYTVSRHKRDSDFYSEGGIIGKRPDYAVEVYSKLIRKAYPSVPIIIGGLEASLRRLAHYDYLKDTLKPSILYSSGADLLVYGMGENSILEIADGLNSGLSIKDLVYIRGTAFITKDTFNIPSEAVYLPSYKEDKESKTTYAKSFNIQYNNCDAYSAKVLVEKYEDKYVVLNPPQYPLTQEELDHVYELDYERTYHPMYKMGVPSIKEVKFSIAINRGCLGSCSFCSLNFHQGRIIQSRSKASIIKEAKLMIKDPDFKGYIHDVGGPSANFYIKACDKQEKFEACNNRSCLFPSKCRNLKVSHKEYLDILRELRSLDGVKKVFVRSGIRYDYLMYDKDSEFFNELVKYHISGQLRVAPEHISDKVLKYMQKPSFKLYEEFTKKFYEINNKLNMNQYIVPYLMSSHPGSELSDAIEMAIYLKKNHIRVDQVQDFYPTPGTLSTCMYYTGLDPRTLEEVKVTKNPHEKAMQRALIQWWKPEFYDLIKEALLKANRSDLIGYSNNCIIKPKNQKIINKRR